MSSLAKNTATGTATTDMDKKRADLMAALTANQGSVSGGVSNKKTETIAPASPDTKDKGAVVSAPVYKQPQAETGVAHPTSAPKSTQVNYTDPTGAQQTGYLINGTTYTDPDGKNPVAVGSTVTLPNGDQWHKGANGSYQVSKTTTTTGSNYSDLSPLINQSYDKGDQMIRDSVNYQTQQGVDQLNRALQDAQPNYAAAIANQLLEAKQAQDAKAYLNQINGDRGGIGSAQVDSIGNTGARNREAIAQQQRQLATDTARQIADLRAQGKYEEASQLLQNNQARLSDLYNEQVRLQSEEQRRTESLAALGQSYMSAGLMPNKDMLAALGIDEATAKLYIDLVNAQQTGGTTGGSPTKDDAGDGDNEPRSIVEDEDKDAVSPVDYGAKFSDVLQTIKNSDKDKAIALFNQVYDHVSPDQQRELDAYLEAKGWLQVDANSKLALGFGPISDMELDQYVRDGIVEEYIEKGWIKFRLTGSPNAQTPSGSGHVINDSHWNSPQNRVNQTMK